VNLYIHIPKMCEYYEINSPSTGRQIQQLWHSMWLLELIEIGWGNTPDDGLTADPALPYLYSTAAFRSRFKELINNLDMLTEQTIHGEPQ